MLFPSCLLCLSLSHKCLCELRVLISWQLELHSEGISGTGCGCFLTAVTFRSLLSLRKESPHLGLAKAVSELIFPGFCTQRMCFSLFMHCLLKCRHIKIEYYFHKSHYREERLNSVVSRNNWIRPMIGQWRWEMATCQEVHLVAAHLISNVSGMYF